jgi:hypothetical protein
MPLVDKMLTISSNHIPPDADIKGLACVNYTFGHIFFGAEQELEVMEQNGKIVEQYWLFYALKLCIREGCTVLRFDTDARKHPDLVEYDY